MKERHTALIVEDDKETADDLVDIMQSIDCDSVVADNRDDALLALQNRSFCLILLDLQIKSAADSIKGNVEFGKALMRKTRQTHSEHNGTTFWLPILVVSGFAREREEAVGVMKDGASDVIQKPLDSQRVSERIRQALEASGRHTHELCLQKPPAQRSSFSDGVVISIPGDRVRRRTRVLVGVIPVELTDSLLKVLLKLLVGHRKGSPVHKVELGATSEQGFKGISLLRNELKPILGSVNIIENDCHGNYSFTDLVTIGECSVEGLRKLGDQEISNLAQKLVGRLKRVPKKV
jgi:DNA-binding response OmpR family regulator